MDAAFIASAAAKVAVVGAASTPAAIFFGAYGTVLAASYVIGVGIAWKHRRRRR